MLRLWSWGTVQWVAVGAASFGCDARVTDRTLVRTGFVDPSNRQLFEVQAAPGMGRRITRVDLEYGPGALRTLTLVPSGATDRWSQYVDLPSCQEAIPYRFRVFTETTDGETPLQELSPGLGFFTRRIHHQPSACHDMRLTDHSAFVAASTADLPDAAPGDGFCSTLRDPSAPGAECTLRAAVMEANARAGWDTILLTGGQRYTLTRSGRESDTTPIAGVGDLDLSDDVRIDINATGCSSTLEDMIEFEIVDSLPFEENTAFAGPRIDASGTSRAFDIVPKSDGTLPEVHLNCMHVLGARRTSATLSALDGAGIRNRGVLRLQRVGISSSRFPGGLDNSRGAGVSNYARLSITDSALVGNQGETGGAVFGGTDGGALFNASTGEVQIERSLIGFNTAARGPEIVNQGDLEIVNSTVYAWFLGGSLARRGAISNTGSFVAEWSTLLAMYDSLFDSTTTIEVHNGIVGTGGGYPLCYAGRVNAWGTWTDDGSCLESANSNHVASILPTSISARPRPRIGFAPGVEPYLSDVIDSGFGGGCPLVDQYGRLRPYATVEQCDPGAVEDGAR